MKEKKRFHLPHVFILLMLVMLIVMGLSYVIPSGSFEVITDETTGSTSINPNNFQYLAEKTYLGFMDFFNAIPQGISDSVSVIVSVLMVTGALAIYEKTGAIGAGIHKLIKISKGKENLVVLALLLVFAVLGTIGFGEGGLPFIPLAVTVVMALGYDRMAGMATAQLGFAAGFTSGVFNLFTTGISQSLVGLQMFSGWQFRLIAFGIYYVICAVYLLKYCKKIKEDPSKSIVKEEYMNQKTESGQQEEIEFTLKRKITLIVLGFAFIFQAYGALSFGWGLLQIGAFYIIVAIIGALINTMNPNEACNTFAIGASRLIPACLTIGMARAVYVLMDQANIIDTFIYKLSNLLDGQSSVVIIVILYVAIICFNFLVVSGSGKAMILMPILGPLSKLTGITPQTMIVLFQTGDGFTNYLFPTSGALVAGLAMCNVSWSSWAKFAWKLFVVLILVGFLMVCAAQTIGL